MGFSNGAQRFTGSNYLDEDSPFTKPVLHSLFCDCLHKLVTFRLGGTVKIGEEEDYGVNELINENFI